MGTSIVRLKPNHTACIGIIAAGVDATGIVAVLDVYIVTLKPNHAAHIGIIAAGVDVTGVVAVLNGSIAQSNHTACVGTIAAGVDVTGIVAVLDGSIAQRNHAARIISGNIAVHNTQILDRAAAVHPAEQALIPRIIVDIHPADGVVIAVKGAGIAATADGLPLLKGAGDFSAVIGQVAISVHRKQLLVEILVEDNIRLQLAVGGSPFGIEEFLHLGQIAVDDIPEELQIVFVIDKVIGFAVLRVGFLLQAVDSLHRDFLMAVARIGKHRKLGKLTHQAVNRVAVIIFAQVFPGGGVAARRPDGGVQVHLGFAFAQGVRAGHLFSGEGSGLAAAVVDTGGGAGIQIIAVSDSAGVVDISRHAAYGGLTADRAGVVAVCDSAGMVDISRHAADVDIGAGDRAGVVAVCDRGTVLNISHHAADIGSAAADGAGVVAGANAADVDASRYAADAGSSAIDAAGVIAVLDSAAAVDASHHAADIGSAADAAVDHAQVLHGTSGIARAHIAKQALVVRSIVDIHPADGAAAAVKGAGVPVAAAADGGPALHFGGLPLAGVGIAAVLMEGIARVQVDIRLQLAPDTVPSVVDIIPEGFQLLFGDNQEGVALHAAAPGKGVLPG